MTGSFFFILDQDTVSRAVKVLELVIAHGPEEGRETNRAHSQGDRYQEGQQTHSAALASRRELPTTMSELIDIATAARRGVT